MEDKIKAAFDKALSKNTSVRETGEAYSVPKSSPHDILMNHIRTETKYVTLAPFIGTFGKMLSDEEGDLVAHTNNLDIWLMPLTK
jgi:hypothetical protein